VTWQLFNPDDGRPIYYDLELSTDGRETYVPITQGITDTMYNWNIPDLDNGMECWLRVLGYSVDSTLVGFDETDSSFVIMTTGISEPESPVSSLLNLSAAAYPNPGHNQTTIHFQLPKTSKVTLKIYNVLGQHICTLSDQQKYTPGRHYLAWNGNDKFGNLSASGIYIYSLNAEELAVAGRMVLLR
jgi:hypothetical protein